MISIDLEGALSLINDYEIEVARGRAREALTDVKEERAEGAEWLGWRDLLANPDYSIIDRITSLSTDICEDADILIVCGIGGSYLGARAVIEALHGLFPSGHNPEVLYAGNNLSSRYLQQLIDYISEPKANGEPKSVYINVISKSGTTLETALAFRILRKWFYDTYGDDADDRIICTTSKKGGALNKVIEERGYSKFVIPADIGGRFSVLTPVGLLPMAIAGIDVKALFNGAISQFKALENDGSNIIDYAAARYALYKNGKEIDIIGSFHPELSYLSRWMQQLLGESEGKDGKGIFPTVTTYSTDLHSLGQMIQQGERNLMETFITIKNRDKGIEIEPLDENNDGLNYLAGKSYQDVNHKAFLGTRQAHIDGGVPSITVSIDHLDEENIGQFIYFYELFTATFVYCLQVNPFNQPGVEAYKKAMYQLLGKNGA